MANIDLVVKIPEEKYLYAKSLVNGGKENNPVVLAIGNGTPLPEGHGRLIDADKAEREENSKMVDFETTNTRDRSYCRYARMILNNAPTIIEADEAESEE